MNISLLIQIFFINFLIFSKLLFFGLIFSSEIHSNPQKLKTYKLRIQFKKEDDNIPLKVTIGENPSELKLYMKGFPMEIEIEKDTPYTVEILDEATSQECILNKQRIISGQIKSNVNLLGNCKERFHNLYIKTHGFEGEKVIREELSEETMIVEPNSIKHFTKQFKHDEEYHIKLIEKQTSERKKCYLEGGKEVSGYATNDLYFELVCYEGQISIDKTKDFVQSRFLETPCKFCYWRPALAMTSIGLAGLSLGQYNVQNSTNSEIDNYTTYSPFLSTRVGPILPIYLVNDASARAETAGNKMLIYGGLAAIPGIILLIDYYYFKPEVQAKSDVSGFNWDFKMTPLSPYRPGLNGNRSFENQMTFDYTILF